MHHANDLQEWFAQMRVERDLRIFCLPSYSPELSTDEYSNRSLKGKKGALRFYSVDWHIILSKIIPKHGIMVQIHYHSHQITSKESHEKCHRRCYVRVGIRHFVWMQDHLPEQLQGVTVFAV